MNKNALACMIITGIILICTLVGALVVVKINEMKQND